MTCRCAGILHALNADERRRARNALERAQAQGNREAASHHQARLDQCPTTILTVQERPA